MNTSPQPFQLWPPWCCIKDTSKVGREGPLQHKEIDKIPEKWPYQEKQKLKRIHSFSPLPGAGPFGKRPQTWCQTRAIPANNSCYWKMMQLFLNCCTGGVFPKPDQLPPTCKDTTATPLPFPGGEGKGVQSAGCCGHSHAGSPCLGLWVFVKVAWLVLAFFRNCNYFQSKDF